MTAVETTWDGLEIAADDPRGATVVVRRPVDGEHFEYLLLHRAHHGPDFAGPWAWTPPAGARQPGEAVEPAALRELREEAGIDGVDIHPVDLSDGWARFYAEVPADTRVDLIDDEHDDYQWVTPAQAGRLCRPSAVARQVPIVDTIPATRFTFREATDADTPRLTAWRRSAHIAPWLPDAPGEDATGHITLADGRPAGYAAHRPGRPGTVRIEFFLADDEAVSRGLGATFLWSYLRQVVIPAHPRVEHVAALVGTKNRPGQRALERAGFRRRGGLGDGEYARAVYSLDRAHWFG